LNLQVQKISTSWQSSQHAIVTPSTIQQVQYFYCNLAQWLVYLYIYTGNPSFTAADQCKQQRTSVLIG